MMNKRYGLGGWERVREYNTIIPSSAGYSSNELVDAVLWCVGAVVVMAKII